MTTRENLYCIIMRHIVYLCQHDFEVMDSAVKKGPDQGHRRHSKSGQSLCRAGLDVAPVLNSICQCLREFIVAEEDGKSSVREPCI